MPTAKPLHQAHIAAMVKDRTLRQSLVRFFQKRLLADPIFASTPEALLTHCASDPSVDLILVDLSAMGDRTTEIIHNLIQPKDRGIMVFSTSDQSEQKLEALSAGADMYMDLPIEPSLLEASLNNLFKRIQQIQSINQLIGQADKPWQLSLNNWRVFTPDDIEIDLTATEFTLLQTLVNHKKAPVSRYHLAEKLGRHQCDNYERYINTLISRLRHKLNQNTRYPANIKASRGKGYQLTTQFRTV